MFHLLILIFYLFRDIKPNLSEKLWGFSDRHSVEYRRRFQLLLKAVLPQDKRISWFVVW